MRRGNGIEPTRADSAFCFQSFLPELKQFLVLGGVRSGPLGRAVVLTLPTADSSFTRKNLNGEIHRATLAPSGCRYQWFMFVSQLLLLVCH